MFNLINQVQCQVKKVCFGERSENFRYGRHTYFFIFFFLEKNMILCISKGILPFKMSKIMFFFFLETLKKNLGFTSKIGQVTFNTSIFFYLSLLVYIGLYILVTL